MEPLCYRPSEISILTDSQIAWINRAAKRHADELEKAKGNSGNDGNASLENAKQSSEAEFDAFLREKVKQ